MRVVKLAWRNVWRNRRRSIVTISAMTLGLVVMILYAGLVEGYLVQMESSVVELEIGDLQIFADDYRENPSVYTRINEPEVLLDALSQAGFPASARLLAWGMAAVGESSAGVSLRGVDVDRDASVSELHSQVAAGAWLDPALPREVVIGRGLARTLVAAPGSELLVLTQAADGGMAYELYQVRGVLNSVSQLTDRSGIFLTAEAFRELVVVPTGVHQLVVRRPPDVSLATAAAVVREVGVALAASLTADLDIKTWRELLPTLASLLDSTRAVMVVMFFIVYIAIAILILNAMLMAVFERIREFGVLKAIGMGPRLVLALIFVESGIQVAIAVGCGLLLGVPGLLYLERFGLDIGLLAGTTVMGMSFDSVWRASITPTVLTRPVAVLVGIVSVAVLYPALKAALIQPVDAMRHH